MLDVIIIGAGPAGLSAALWCDELGLDTLVLEAGAEVGGQLLAVHHPIENYLGLRAESGRELRDRFAEQAESAEFDLWTGVEIESVDLRARRVALRSGEELQAISLILATGVRRRRLGIPGEAELAGRGVTELGQRDLFAGRDVCVVGGGDDAAENAIVLAEVCPTVTLVNRGQKLSARNQLIEGLRARHCVTVFNEAELTRIIGGERVEAVEVRRRGALKPFQMAVGGVLVTVGVEPVTEMFSGQVETDERGYVHVTSERETSVKNVFAVGDVANPLSRTISTSVGDGATAAKVIAARLTRA
jgi:thioredoxin reductase (NADPH)